MPRLLYEDHPLNPNEVILHASFVPNFESGQHQDWLHEDEEPESTTLMNPADFLYVFLIDRSGSMEGQRISDAKKALVLFLQSLSPLSKFQVISFGDSYNLISLSGSSS
jgi:hypothetical protein